MMHEGGRNTSFFLPLKSMKTTFPSAIAIFAIASLSSQPAEAKTIKVACVGDSITYGATI